MLLLIPNLGLIPFEVSYLITHIEFSLKSHRYPIFVGSQGHFSNIQQFNPQKH